MNSVPRQTHTPTARFLVFAALLLGATTIALRYGHAAPTEQQGHGIVLADMDRSIAPGDDFYRYSNGHWLSAAVIPPDRSSVSVFSRLAISSDQRVAALIKDLVSSPGSSTPGERKVADLYRSYMDEAGIESKGLKPLAPDFAAINAIRDQHDLARFLGDHLRADVDPLNNTNYHTANLIGLWVAPGFADADHYTAYLLQGGLEMPDREYYLQDSISMRNIRAKYRAHVVSMLKLAGISEPEGRADRVIALEHALAEQLWSLADDQDIHKANNLWRRSEFAAKAPGLDWGRILPRRRARIAEHVHRLAGECDYRRGGAGWLNTSRHLERLADLPRH